MSKDPFAILPEIQPEDRFETESNVPPDHVDTTDDLSAGTPPRTLLKSATKWSVPLLGVALGIWLFMPQDKSIAVRATPGPTEVDTARQADETVAMMRGLKEEAEKKPPVPVPVMPGSLPPTASVANAQSVSYGPSASGTYTPASQRLPQDPAYGSAVVQPTSKPAAPVDEKAAQAYAAAAARQDEIRASAIEVTKVKLVGQPGADGSKPAALAGLQSDLGEAEKTEAVRAQQAMQERVMAAMAPKETARSRGSNDDFLATNSAASNSAPTFTRQMAPQASTIVSEGHVIRSVLLTRVSSDLPGRVLARVTSDVYDSKQRYIVIPKGSQLIGVYSSQVVVGQERLLMAMNKLILPNGNWISLSGAGAADLIGMAGVKAEVNNHFMKMFGTSLVLGATSLFLPKSDTTVSTLQGMNSNGGSGTAGSVFATSFNEVLKTLLERNKQIAPTLSLQEGEEFIFMVAQDMAMVPYQP